jgi:hypothetical protein
VRLVLSLLAVIVLAGCESSAWAGARPSVLVTAFHDWHELGDPPNVWRCRDNPSCRLLVGEERMERPRELEGPLVHYLRESAPEVDFTFRTMTTEWGAFSDVPRELDLVVNLGLGVYDHADRLQLERGAINLRRGRDAGGRELAGPIEPGAPRVRMPPAAVRARIDALQGRTFHGFEVQVARARRSNSYLCNETHWYALGALGDRPREAYFVHIPHAKNGDYDRLTHALGDLVLALIEER